MASRSLTSDNPDKKEGDDGGVGGVDGHINYSKRNRLCIYTNCLGADNRFMNGKILGEIEIPPSTNLIKALGSSGYTIESAIADIVDNSISNGASRIDVSFERNGPNSYIEVSDNGNGMNKPDLQNAMRLAEKSIDDVRDEGDLGRFGVGMKTASCSFCNELQVVSKGSSGLVNSYIFPFDSDRWVIKEVEVSQDLIIYPTGTKVIWRRLRLSNDPNENNRILCDIDGTFYEMCDDVAHHLSKVFGLILLKGDVEIFVNGNKLEGWTPFAVPGNGPFSQCTFKEHSFLIGGKHIRVECYLLPNKSKMNQNQLDYVTCGGEGPLADFEGFYVYRNNRLLSCDNWQGMKGFGLSEKYNYARIGIWFDSSVETDKYFGVNFAKNHVQFPSEFCQYLKPIAKSIRQKSANSYDFKANPRPYKRRSKSDDIQVWTVTKNSSFSKFTVNENHPLVKRFTEGLDKKRKTALFKLLEREFPFKELEVSLPGINEYSEDELRQMMEEEFQQKVDVENLSLADARNAILSMSPFSDEKYRSKCVFIFAKILELRQSNDGNDN